MPGFGQLSGYKTYIAAALAFVAAVLGFFTGDATFAEAVQLAVTAVLGATIRHGVGE